MIKQAVKKILPRGSLAFMVARRIAILLGITPALPLHELQFSDWTDRVEPLNWSPYQKLPYEPLISVVVPVFNTPAMHFLPMAYSVVNQTYQRWELVLVNASSDEKARAMTKQARLIDDRIRVIDLPKNLGIAGNTNAGIAKARGEYVGFLDHDDMLAPQALYEVARVLQDHSKPQLVYSDEDKLTNNGEYRVDPHFKPDWSPQLLRELNYMNHFTVVEKALLTKVGMCRSNFEGAQDYDLFLRIVDEHPHIAHVPKILYHWRTAKTSTAENFSQKKNVLDAGVRALEEHLARNNQEGSVKAVPDQPGFYKIDYTAKKDTRIAILALPSVLQAEYRKFLFNFVEHLTKAGQPVDIFVQPLRVPLKHVPGNITVHIIKQTERRAFVREAVEHINTDLTLVIGGGILTARKYWLKRLIGLMSQVSSIAIAAPHIYTGGGKIIVDAGLVARHGGWLPLFQGYPDEQHTPFGNSDWVRNVDAVSARCFITRTNILRNNIQNIQPTGPLFFTDEFFSHLRERGQEVVMWPFSRVTYAGEMDLPANHSPHFNQNLIVSRTEFASFEAIRVARSYKDE